MNYVHLVNILNRATANMCGVGTKYVKLYLNSLVKNGDFFGSVVRMLLEAETCNVNAKKYGYDYKENYYGRKYSEVNGLISFLIKNGGGGMSFGFERSDVPPASYIVYFHHVFFGQISFHCDVTKENMIFIKKYDRTWDGITDSSLNKLEACIEALYGSAIREKYSDKVTEKGLEESRKRVRLGKTYIMRSNVCCLGYDYLLDKGNVVDDGYWRYFNNADRKEYNKWIIGLVKDRGFEITGETVEEVYEGIYGYLSQTEELSHLADGFSDVGLGLYLHNVTDDDIKRFSSMFEQRKINKEQRVVFVGDFDSFSEKDWKKLSAYIPFMSDNRKRRFRDEYAKYIVKKYGIVVDYGDVDELYIGKKVKNKVRKNIEKKKQSILISHAVSYVKENGLVNIF